MRSLEKTGDSRGDIYVAEVSRTEAYGGLIAPLTDPTRERRSLQKLVKKIPTGYTAAASDVGSEESLAKRPVALVTSAWSARLAAAPG